MAEMSTHERVARMYAHQEADRIPITDSPWKTTIERWQREGMPEDVHYVDYFELDRFARFGVDNSPRFPEEVVEETEQYVVQTTRWGATLRNWKHITSTPEWLDFRVKGPDLWREAKERMTPSRDRIPWAQLEATYSRLREEGAWIEAGFWFGFDVTHARMVGTERFLIAMVTDPEWCVDVFNHFLDVNIALWEQVLAAGYTLDGIRWPDDMGYKYNQFFSLHTYRELLKPVHRRAIEWAHAHGMVATLHSCGDVHPLLPELIEIGLDGLNPLEVKAGMDPVQIKRDYGDDLLLHGGINAVLWDDREAIEAEMRRVVPVLKEKGGYVFSSDHSVPDSVSLEGFRYIVEPAKELGSYAG
jgi:uroporphyrinogen decarboxylase